MHPNSILLEKNRELNGPPITNGEIGASAWLPPAGRIAISPSPPVIQVNASARLGSPSLDSAYDEQATPKAPAVIIDDGIPSLLLSLPEPSSSSKVLTSSPDVLSSGQPQQAPLAPAAPTPSFMMPPPPRPIPSARAYAAGSSTLPQASPLPNRSLPIPNRGPPNGLTPPPTVSSKPKKLGKEVALKPGHSPLDWARMSGPGADLRGLPRDTPYLRVTPSMLKKYTGRKGKDAWTVLGGKVYNMTPYLPFHPGGEPELLRGAARDGTTLFAEIHPWVNYEGMLSACLVGIYVPEEEGKDSQGVKAGGMDEMD